MKISFVATIVFILISSFAYSEEAKKYPEPTLAISNISLSGRDGDGFFSASVNLNGVSCGISVGYNLVVQHVKTPEEAKEKLKPEIISIFDSLKKDKCEEVH